MRFQISFTAEFTWREQETEKKHERMQTTEENPSQVRIDIFDGISLGNRFGHVLNFNINFISMKSGQL